MASVNSFFRFLLICIYTGTAILIKGQSILSISPGAHGGSSGAIKSVHEDIRAAYGNQAGLAYLKEASFYASVERRFGTEGLSFYSLVGALPTKYGHLGLSIFYHGFDQYNEQLIGITYARKLFDQLSVGARFDVIQANIATYGRTSTLTAEIGLMSQISPTIILGTHVYNPFEIQWLENETLPTIVVAGLAYTPTSKIWVSGEIEKVSDFRENIKWGLQYYLVNEVALRFGFNTNPSMISFGIGYNLTSGFSFDAGTSMHQELGLSPLAGLGYTRKKS